MRRERPQRGRPPVVVVQQQQSAEPQVDLVRPVSGGVRLVPDHRGGLGVGHEDLIHELLGPSALVVNQDLALELLEQFLACPFAGEDHADVEEEVGEILASEALFRVLPPPGVGLRDLLVDLSDDLGLEDVGRRQVEAPGVHDAEDAMGAVQVRGADRDQEGLDPHQLAQGETLLVAPGGQGGVQCQGVRLDGPLRVRPEVVGVQRQERADGTGGLDVLLEEVGIPRTQGEPGLGLQPQDRVPGLGDHRHQIGHHVGLLRQVAQHGQKDGQGCQALLTVDDVGLGGAAVLDEHQRAEEVGFPVTSEEGFLEVGQELLGLFGLPCVGALVVRDPEVVVTAEDFVQWHFARFKLSHDLHDSPRGEGFAAKRRKTCRSCEPPVARIVRGYVRMARQPDRNSLVDAAARTA